MNQSSPCVMTQALTSTQAVRLGWLARAVLFCGLLTALFTPPLCLVIRSFFAYNSGNFLIRPTGPRGIEFANFERAAAFDFARNDN